MKMFLFTLAILGSIMLVGMVEDPCHTEGLSTGCMEIQ